MLAPILILVGVIFVVYRRAVARAVVNQSLNLGLLPSHYSQAERGQQIMSAIVGVAMIVMGCLSLAGIVPFAPP
jgi:hypothetical protein